MHEKIFHENKKNTRSLDGKRAIFIGNSFIYYGNCVTDKCRDNDKGYFYQLAHSVNESVYVYNCTFGGKNLRYIYENKLLPTDKKLLSDFDLVFLSEAGENNASIMSDIRNIKTLFRKDAEFFYLCHEYTHEASHQNILSALAEMENEGITVVDWGGLVYKIWNSLIDVPGSKTYYTRQTFIKDNKGGINGTECVGAGKPGDRYHQNPLSGYICALMAFCAASGRKALGAEYRFASDSSIHPYFDIDAFIRSHYSSPLSTNLKEILSSEHEIRAIQALIDAYAGN